ncbi:MAG: helix-turn-helix domain-containing protein [Clostridia bacterium]|jgi:transcriptional regulator with XRE-family HTH domain|nr:helix-turn-helix domain-containing protein [Clostridia bacterium]MCI2015814.1 helix-turn-helix domain-containing protein [Clostridia bacterium]
MLNDRIKLLRKEYLKLTQEEFASKIKISRANLGSIETKRINVTDRVISDICKEFNVNKDWILNGSEPIFIKPEKFSLDAFVKEHNMSDLELEIIKKYFELEPSVRKKLLGLFENPNTIDKSEKYSSEFGVDNNIDKEVESYRRELEYEKAAKMSGASQPLEDEKHA